MKKYFIAVAAMTLLAACSGKQAQKDVPVEVEEEEFAVMSAAPDAPSLPLIHSVKATQSTKPVNMRDSLKVDPKKGAVIQKKYKGTVTSPDSVSVDYDLTLYYQQDNADEDGVFELDALYTEPVTASNTATAKKAPKKAVTTGKQKVKHGTPDDASAVIYELIPSDGEPVIYFQVEGDNLTLMNQALQKAASDLNYTLKLVQ